MANKGGHGAHTCNPKTGGLPRFQGQPVSVLQLKTGQLAYRMRPSFQKKKKKLHIWLGMATYICNPSIQEVKTSELL